MSEAFSLMWWPLMACFVLVGIHAYLGIQVIARKVIFVDLALAQIAGLGAVYGVFLGLSFESDAWAIKGISVLFTLIGAVLFAFTRTNDERVPQEATIGIIYAAALSMTVLVTANLPHGADEVQQMLAGNILWVTKREVFATAVLYAAIGLVHYIFRRQFLSLSHGHGAGLHSKLWDFLFYATFGVVVTSSVGMGGVLLVFGYLVIPSVIGIRCAQSTIWRLVIGWGTGALMSVAGVAVSYYLDLPSGPTIVVLLGLLLLMITLVQELRAQVTRRQGLVHALIIALAVLVALAIPLVLNFTPHDHEAHKTTLHLLTHGQLDTTRSALHSPHDDEVIAALTSVSDFWLVDLLPDVLPLIESPDDRKREGAVKVLASLGDARGVSAILKAIRVEKDIFIKIEMAEAIIAMHDKQGLVELAQIMTAANSTFARDDAYDHLRSHLVDAPEGILQLDAWLHENFSRLHFDEAKKKFFLYAPPAKTVGD